MKALFKASWATQNTMRLREIGFVSLTTSLNKNTFLICKKFEDFSDLVFVCQ